MSQVVGTSYRYNNHPHLPTLMRTQLIRHSRSEKLVQNSGSCLTLEDNEVCVPFSKLYLNIIRECDPKRWSDLIQYSSRLNIHYIYWVFQNNARLRDIFQTS